MGLTYPLSTIALWDYEIAAGWKWADIKLPRAQPRKFAKALRKSAKEATLNILIF